MVESVIKYHLGVNVIGYATGEFGGGEGLRCTLRALGSASIPFTVKNISVPWHRNLDSTYTDFSEDNPYPINLVHINPDSLSFDSCDTQYLQKRYNIGFWAWELKKFPSNWEFAFDLFDEVWTYSSYGTEAISEVSPIPVQKMMPSIDLPQPSLDREAFGLPKDKLIFLFIFDFHSVVARKNPQAVIKAFKQAFSKSNQDVLLVIKFSNGQHHPQQRNQLYALSEDYASIRFIDGHLTKSEVNALIYNCDCYVSLHRAEGFGLTMAEAMFYGKPVIATAYSSNTDFMNVGNSFPVKYELVTTTEDYFPYPKGSIWAEPDIAHAASLMQYVFHNYRKAQEVGARAAEDIKSLLSPQLVGQKIRSRLEHIMGKINPSASSQIKEIEAEIDWRDSQLKAWRQTAEQAQVELEECRKQIFLTQSQRQIFH